MALPKLDTPIYETKLISNGKTVKFRPFLVKEQKLFLMAMESNDPKDIVNTIKQVLTNCILNDEINVEELSSFDLEYLFMQLRAKSVGEIVNLKYTCNNVVKDAEGNDKTCNGIVKFDINIAEIKPQVSKDHTKDIKITNTMGIMMKYPTFKVISEFEDTDPLKLIVACIDYIYDKDNIYYAKDTSDKELIEFLENMLQEDFAKIENFFNTFPKFSKDLHFKCGKCGYEEDIKVEGLQSFFV